MDNLLISDSCECLSVNNEKAVKCKGLDTQLYNDFLCPIIEMRSVIIMHHVYN